jgi:dTDP-4-amino-4,6-dideoxygalactose transaminase
VLVKNRDEVIKKLKTKGVFVSDTWYKKVVDGGKFGGRSQYKKGTCMRAEAVSGKILNLPTHRYVDEKTADKIAKIVRSYV